MKENVYTLSQLALIIKEVISVSFNSSIWVKAEISELHENRNGNCYLELIEKDINSEKIIARLRAIIWDRTYRLLKPYFEQSTQMTLKAGINVLVNVNIEFSEIYGITLIIRDIDPSYTIGNVELQRAQVINKLIADGVFDMNKQLEFPLVPQNVAIISSETAAGYIDFIHHLENNEYGFKFYVKLFKAFMQGDEAEASIINALDSIAKENFDVVVITRGGGSKSDLACFDRYNLCNHICQFPLPVISAIGHERDVSVVDMVSNTRVKTPTAAAQFIIDKVAEFWFNMLNTYEEILTNVKNLVNYQEQFLIYASEKIKNTKHILKNLETSFNSLIANISNRANAVINLNYHYLQSSMLKLMPLCKMNISKKDVYLSVLQEKIKEFSHRKLSLQLAKIESLEKIIIASDPKILLKKGYSITKKEDKTIKYSNEVSTGEQITTILYSGEIVSIVK